MRVTSVSKLFGVAWIIALASGIHGFSIPIWGDLIHEPPVQPLIGKARGIRSDDWVVLQPLAISQTKSNPKFQVTNPLIGEGMNMLLVGPAAIKNQAVLFNPHTWGYFVSANFGLTWCWNFYVFSFLFSFFFLFLLCTKNAATISALGSLALLFSPFFQFWSLNSAAMAAEGALAVVLATHLLLYSKGWKSVLLGVGVGWSLTSFGYWLYPAFQVPIAWTGITIFFGLIFRHLGEGKIIQWTRYQTLGVMSAVLIPLLSFYFFYHDAKDAILVMANTVYPGKRISHGGEFSPWRLFSNNLIPFGFIGEYKVFGNISEAGSSILIYPVVFAVLILDQWRKKIDPLVISLGIALIGFTLWAWAPVPDWLALITGFSRVPGSRSVIGHAVTNIALLVTVSALYFKEGWRFGNQHKKALIIGAVWLILMMLLFPFATQDAPGVTGFKKVIWVLYALGVNFSLAYGVGLRHKLAPIALLFVFHFGVSAPFNPVVKGGAEIFETSGLAKTLLHQPRESKWAVFGDSGLASFTRTVGFRTINGVHFYPQFELWKKLDPKESFKTIYNRYAHVGFRAVPSQKEFQILLKQADVIEVAISPDDPRFLGLGVDCILSQGELPKGASSHWTHVSQFESFHIYKRSQMS